MSGSVESLSATEVGNKQPLKLMSNLKKISSLNLSNEKIMLMENSMFYNLSKVRNQKESSSILIATLCKIYNAEKKMFEMNNGTCFSFCKHEVAAVLGIKDTGTDFMKPSSKDSTPSSKFPDFLYELREKFVKDKKRDFMAAHIKEILGNMSVDNEEDKLRFRQLMSYYIIEQVLLCSSNTKKPRCSYWSLVTDHERFESFNWAKATLDHLLDSINETKLKLVEKADNKGQHCFKGAAPVLEAMLYERIPSIRPSVCCTDPPLIQKYGPQRNNKVWTLDQLTPADITNCDYCSRGSTPVQGSIPPVIYVSHDFLAEDEVPNTFTGLSLEDDEAEDEAEDEVPIMDATAEASAAQQHDVRRSKREKKPVSKLINEISGKKKPKKPNEKRITGPRTRLVLHRRVYLGPDSTRCL